MSAALCTLKRTSATETPNKSQLKVNLPEAGKGNPPEKLQRLQLLRERQHQRLEARIDTVIRESGCGLDDIDEVEDEEAA